MISIIVIQIVELCTAPDSINEPFIYEEPKVVNFDTKYFDALVNQNEAMFRNVNTAPAEICMGTF